MLIDIPLIVQIILIGLAWVMWKVLPSRLPWRIATISVVVLLSVFLWESAFYLHEAAHYPLRISTAIDYHFREHKSLPDDPSDIEYGAELTRGRAMTLWGDSWGPTPHYLPADEPDMIVIVIPPTWRDPYWRCLPLMPTGDPPLRWCRSVKTEDELAEVLEEDDRKRAAVGDPHRWSQVNWRH
jgi:hypothetical protein